MTTHSSEQFIHGLAAEFSGVGALLTEHVGYYEELIPHVFFGELTPWLVSTFLDDPRPSDVRSALLSRLDAALAGGSDEVRNLVYVSFVENLPYAGEDGAAVVAELPPTLRAALEEQRPT